MVPLANAASSGEVWCLVPHTVADGGGSLTAIALAVGFAVVAAPRFLPFVAAAEAWLSDVRIALLTPAPATQHADIAVLRITEDTLTGFHYRSPIDRGFLVLLGVAEDDTEDDVIFLAQKIAGLRIFADDAGKMNLSLGDVEGKMLVVSQFTLLGDCRKGRRPSFVRAARPEKADELYRSFVAEIRGQGVPVETGRFQEQMDVQLINNGPVTLLLDSRKEF